MKELSKENPVEFAAQFEMLKLALHVIDWEYAEKLVSAMRDQASRQETLAMFNPSYPLVKNDLIRQQANALGKFVEGVKILQECDSQKREVCKETDQRKNFTEMFL